MAESDEPLDRLRAALENRLNRAVAVVANPTRHAGRDGVPPHGVSEEHALHEPVHDHAAADHAHMIAGRFSSRRR